VILLTVGSQLPFCRLVRAVDEWCAASGRTDVIAQIGNPGANGYRPKHLKASEFIAPGEFDALFARADLVIAHAGMGSIISALRNAKPIVIMPRRASLGEHRNEHQQATAARFAGRQNVYVADDETVLAATLQRAAGAVGGGATISPYADRKLTSSLRRYILTGDTDLGQAPELLGKEEGAPG
jgi:UDP-N-acetylglucosamine transferase subunit ALG13